MTTTNQPARYKDLTTEQMALVEAAMKAVDAYGTICYQFGAAEEDDDPDTTPAFNAARDALVNLFARGIAEGLRQATEGARSGYDAAIATLTDVADRTGSASARYWADYLTVDPDRRAPAVGPWEPAEQPGEARWELGGEDVTHLVQSAPERLVVHLDNRPAEQPEPDRSAPARIHVRHDPAALMEEPDLYADEKPGLTEGTDRG